MGLKKLWNMKVTIIPIWNWCSWCSHQRTNKETERLRNKKMIGDHPNY